MKKMMLLAVAMSFIATTASARVVGSSHDFTGKTYGGGSTCAYCHMPHNGATASGAPLWSRNYTYTQTYTYFSSTAGGKAQPASLGAGTRVCLSCHDGTQAIAVVFNVAGGTQNISTSGTDTTKLTGQALIGPNLSNDHPVSVSYDTAGIGGLVSAPNAVYNIGQGVNIECTSCHNAHNASYAQNLGTPRQGSGQYPNRQFLVSVTSAGVTDFCAGCHGNK